MRKKENICFMEGARGDIPIQPTVPKMPKTGHWIVVPGMNEQCSKCGKFFPLSYFKDRPFEINYCPNCGACMKDCRMLDEFIEDSKESERV